MTIKEFEYYNKTESMPSEWIGQGYGYKETGKEWNDIEDDEIIYIPEYGYDNNDTYDGYTVERKNAYTKNDFKRLIKENNINGDTDLQAMILFDEVDWQFPESLIDEGFFEEE